MRNYPEYKTRGHAPTRFAAAMRVWDSIDARRTARMVLLALLTVIICGSFSDRAPGAEPVKFAKPFLIRFEGAITPMRTKYLFRGIDRAQDAGADLLVIEIHSPGGYLQESLDIANRLKTIKWAKTVAFVRSNEEALSGAAIASLGCDEIVMGGDAVMGDAGPIYQNEGAMFEHAPEKIRSDLARKVRDLASHKGRAPALAEAMVDMDLEVFRVRNKDDGSIHFMSQSEIESDEKPDRWETIQMVHESRKAKFLEVNGNRAVELELAQGNAANRGELAVRFSLETDFQVVEPNSVDMAVYILNLPIITVLLFIIGFIALYFEFSAPGISIGGLTAGLCFALFFWSRFLGGTAGWLEVILFVSGFVFIAVELFVIPGFGVAGVTGILLIFASVVLASQTFILPETVRDWESLRGTLFVLMGPGFAFIVGAYIITKVTGNIPLLSNLALKPPSVDEEDEFYGDKGGKAEPPAHELVQVGDWGIANTPLRPSGKAQFGDEFVDVATEGTFVNAGAQIRVLQIHGHKITVREIS